MTTLLPGFSKRSLVALGHDIAAAAAAWMVAYWLRFNLNIPPDYFRGMTQALGWVVATQTATFLAFRLYRGIWRYASLPDLKRIVMAVAVGAMAATLVLKLGQNLAMVPRSVLILDPLLLLVIMGGNRLLYRAWKEHRLYGLASLQGRAVLVLGAGDAAATLVKDLARSPDWRVVGLLDDADNRQGRQLHGLPVLGRLEDLPRVAADHGAEDAIIAMPGAGHGARRRALEICTAAGIKPLTVPSFDDLVSGRVKVSQIREVELDDLLGRDPVTLDSAGLHALLEGHSVMVTGAGGSIGSELCRQIARFSPSRLVMLDLSEFALYTVEQEFRESFPGIPIACAVGDVKNEARVRQVLEEHRPRVVFHAAAYKHVPLMERENAWEAVRNNVLGTLVVARACVAAGVERFVLVSTDKAVNPTNVMGASKRLAEMVCQSAQSEAATRFVMVRFGNVLGSTGSVVPKFREQIARGGPVTVTHPDVIRYFMSIPEAAQLVLQAGLMGEGGEIFVLDMGQPVRIVDLARDMIRLSGFAEGDIRIEFTGLRPGEKLFEELLADDEHTLPTPHPKLRIARARPVEPGWIADLTRWLDEPPQPDESVRAGLALRVPEYAPAEHPPETAVAGARV